MTMINDIYKFFCNACYKKVHAGDSIFHSNSLDLRLEIIDTNIGKYYIRLEHKKKVYIFADINRMNPENLLEFLFDNYVKNCKPIGMSDGNKTELALRTEVANLNFKLHQKEKTIEELKKMKENINSLSLHNSVLEDNNKLRKENYELRSELKRLIEDLQEEKKDHTMTKCRSIFATHILNGDRDERVIEHLNISEDMIKEFGI